MDFDIATFLVWYIALILSLVLHEASHAWVAMLGGDRTAYEAGQVTLNPLPHIRREPVGTVVVPIIMFMLMGFPFAFAHAPYNPYWAEAHPRRAAMMSAAGPGANLLLALLLFGVMKLGLSAGWLEFPLHRSTGLAYLEQIVVAGGGSDEGIGAALAKMCSILFVLNLILGIFNLLPLPPLDGAGILEGLAPGPLGGLYRFLRGNQMFALVGLFAAIYLGGKVVWPVLAWAMAALR